MRSDARGGVAFLLAALSPFCAGAQGSGAPEVKFGEPFELQAGQTVSVGGELVLTFLAVAQDSRCPKGEQCITAGKARVRFEAAPRGGEPVAFELETGGASESGELEIAGYRITLLDLGPYPVTGRPIVPEAYTASLTVRKI